MPRPHSRQDWELLLKNSRVVPSKAMGQHFLVEPSIVDRIVETASISDVDHVLEVGPGLGILTSALVDRSARVVAVELDDELAAYLRRAFHTETRLHIAEQDARYVQPIDFDFAPDYKVVANLPYSTATVILRRLLDQPPAPASLTVMVQREVAERMVAQPPNMSLLSIAIQLSSHAHIAMVVPPEAFSPPPRVESAVVHLVPLGEPLIDDQDRAALFRLATLAFQAKRKTLSNSLAHGLKQSKETVATELERLGVDGMRRPQTLSLVEWCHVARSSLGELPK